MANLDHICLDNTSHNGLDVIVFLSELYDSQSLLADTIEIYEKCRKLNHTCHKIVSDFSYKRAFFSG